MASADQPVRKVTIIGGGTAGWSTAAVLSQWLSKVEIKLVESDEIGIVGVRDVELDAHPRDGETIWDSDR